MIKSLLEKLYENTLDTIQRMVVADWYEENGQQEYADCHRWIARHKRHPFQKLITNNRYWWFINDAEKAPNLLPNRLLTRLKKIQSINYLYSENYESIREEEEDLLYAWTKAAKQGEAPTD